MSECLSSGFCLRVDGGCPCVLEGTHTVHACTHAYLWSTTADYAPAMIVR